MGKLDLKEVFYKSKQRTLERYFSKRIGMTLVLNNSKKVKFEDMSCYKDFISLFFNYKGRTVEVYVKELNNIQFVLLTYDYSTEDKKVSNFSSFSHELKQILLGYTECIDNEEYFDLEWE